MRSIFFENEMKKMKCYCKKYNSMQQWILFISVGCWFTNNAEGDRPKCGKFDIIMEIAQTTCNLTST